MCEMPPAEVGAPQWSLSVGGCAGPFDVTCQPGTTSTGSMIAFQLEAVTLFFQAVCVLQTRQAFVEL